MNLQESYNKILESDKFIEKTKREIKFWQIFKIRINRTKKLKNSHVLHGIKPYK